MLPVRAGEVLPDWTGNLYCQKTGARHLSNIFVKLDVSSRTEAAGVAFTHELTERAAP